MSRDDIRRVLTADWIYRKERRWPLIKLSAECNHIEVNFSLVLPLLRKYAGKLALCGGAVSECFTAYMQEAGTMDADLFFYNVTVDEANAILEDCVATLASSDYTKSDGDQRSTSMRIERRHLITNVVFHSVDLANTRQSNRIYQFVHRIYPSLDSILGGFDIPLCMFSFTFEHGLFTVQTTPIGDYCLKNQVLIIDTTRRSTSYEHRILKYQARFGATVIFPGLDMEKVKKKLKEGSDQIRIDYKMGKLETLMDNLGLKFTTDFAPSMIRETFTDYDSDDGDEERPRSLSIKFTNMQITQSKIVRPLNTRSSKRPIGQIPAILKKQSDYGDSRIWSNRVPEANGTMLRCNNLDGVMEVCPYTKPPSYKIALEDFRAMIKSPDIGFKWLVVSGLTAQLYNAQTTRWKICRFAEFHNELYCVGKTKFNARLPEIVKILLERMKLNYAKVVEMLTGVKWITENPGRQWTSSNYPLFENPRDFYGERYERFTVGIPEDIETTLRCVLMKFGCPKDIRNLIARYVVIRNYT